MESVLGFHFFSNAKLNSKQISKCLQMALPRLFRWLPHVCCYCQHLLEENVPSPPPDITPICEFLGDLVFMAFSFSLISVLILTHHAHHILTEKRKQMRFPRSQRDWLPCWTRINVWEIKGNILGLIRWDRSKNEKFMALYKAYINLRRHRSHCNQLTGNFLKIISSKQTVVSLCRAIP